ncbi:MAG: hypothetical protein Q4F95_07540 [Oscillospiraceae bacterium]|nr:hypothetical protein [Oscillospiraceae bacterium]
MKFIKIISIWLAAMLVIIIISNTAGAFIVNKLSAQVLHYGMIGWSKHADTYIHPVKTSEETIDKSNGLNGLIMRSLLTDNHLKSEPGFFYNFLFGNLTIDESEIFLDRNGLNELSSGIFAVVYQSYGRKSDYQQHAIGVIDVRDFIELNNSSEIYSVLDNDPQAVIRLNSYTISNYIVKPVSMTLLDSNGAELLNVEFSYEGELIKASDCYVHNECTDKSYDNESLYHKMYTAKLGERKTDTIAHELVKEVRFDKGDYMDDRINYGMANITVEHIEVTDGYALITVHQHQYIRGVLFYTILLGVLMTIIMLIVIRKRC